MLGAFGGFEFCCRPSLTCDDKLCCPGDGRIYSDNTCCGSGEVELTQANFLQDNVCQNAKGTGSLRLDNIQTQGPQVRAQSSHARQPTRPEWPTSRLAPDPNGPSAPSGLRAARHASVRSCPRLAAFDGAQERVGVRTHLPNKVRQE